MSSIGDSYREADILTAPPQRLHLLLVEGAIRFIERTKYLWGQNEFEAGFEALLRAQEIVAEILSGIKTDSQIPVARQVAALYTFVYRCLVQAGVTRETDHLDDALRVLFIQRDTWQELCRKLAGEGARGVDVQFSYTDSAGHEVETNALGRSAPWEHSQAANPPGPHGLTKSPSSDYAGEYASGFSWDA